MQSNSQGFTLSPKKTAFRDIKLYNSASNKIESVAFENSATPSIYTCGLTVYDHPHLGHLRIMLTMDILTRVLTLQGRDVVTIRNTTDIDDKIIQRAIREQTTAANITSQYTSAMLNIESRLNLMPLSIRPKATDHIIEMQQLIQKLIDSDYAYSTARGNVWLRNAAMEHSFGRLSGKRQDSLGNSRLLDTLDKEEAGDVALWKNATEQPFWESPWGNGRPGWHIECSAMIHAHAGTHLDIHAGGLDLQFPHHEVEWAQSYHATGKDLAKHWMHIGFVQIGDSKMGKSLGNALWARDYLDLYGANALRWWVMSGHYRQPLNAQEKALISAHQTWMKVGARLHNVSSEYHEHDFSRLLSYLEDDLQTPLFLREILYLADTSPSHAKYILEAIGFSWPAEAIPPELLADDKERQQYKTNKDYNNADNLRAKWLNQGWHVQERHDVAYWWYKTW